MVSIIQFGQGFDADEEGGGGDFDKSIILMHIGGTDTVQSMNQRVGTIY